MEDNTKKKMQILTPSQFPALLKEINDPPNKLYSIGELPNDSYKFLSIVGSRKCSQYGKEACEKLIAGLAGQPIVIVSGLAYGIDTIAHQSALKHGLKTIAFPGSGLDDSVIYPQRNFRLSREIVEKGGCLLSEFEPTMPALPYNFPQRNRLMAGMSHATLIIEATVKSGTLITGKLATEYNREVMVVPGSIFDPGSEGPHLLMRLGAAPVTKSEDILEVLHLKALQPDESQTLFPDTTVNIFENPRYQECGTEEKKILKILQTPLSKDNLIRSLFLHTTH